MNFYNIFFDTIENFFDFLIIDLFIKNHGYKSYYKHILRPIFLTFRIFYAIITLAASIACCKAASIALDIPLYHSERVAKYNQLLRIEEELGDSAVYPGIKAFNVH